MGEHAQTVLVTSGRGRAAVRFAVPPGAPEKAGGIGAPGPGRHGAPLFFPLNLLSLTRYRKPPVLLGAWTRAAVAAVVR